MSSVARTLLCLFLVFSSVVSAEPAPIRDYVRYPDYMGATLSRDGRWVAVTIPLHGRMNLAIVDLDTRKARAITNYDDYDVLNVRWVGSEYLLFSVGQIDEASGAVRRDGGGLFAIHRDGGTVRTLSQTARRQATDNRDALRNARFLASIPGSEEEILVTSNERDRRSATVDVYRVNVKAGRPMLLTTQRPERTEEWVLDAKRVPRAAVSSVRDSFVSVVHYRKDEQSPWEELARFDPIRDEIPLIPVAFSDDGQSMLVASGVGRSNNAIYRYDPVKRERGELVAQHPRYDMGADAAGQRVTGPVLGSDGKVVGFAVEADKYQVAWTDAEYQRLQTLVDKALPNTVNKLQRSTNKARTLVASYSDRLPTRWYVLDESTSRMEELARSRPALKPEHLVEMRPFLLKTRDGLEIPSYYFLPSGVQPGSKPDARLPTVVHIHGGPQARADYWSGMGTFGVMEAQLLASRGYAVILPNFRITPGFGRRIFNDGFGTIGRQMSDDHEDAVKWGIDQGFVDPQRVCISGASYGGYATLMAIARAPKMFRCGISGLMVSDLPRQLSSASGDTFWTDMGEEFWLKLIGAKSVSDIPKEISPINLADRITAPLLIYAGEDDIRTPIEQTSSMVRALEKAGHPPQKVIIKSGESHGFGKLENRLELYEAALKFLDQHIGAGRKP